MSNVPHRYTTPKEDIKTGKAMVIGFSIIMGFMVIGGIVILFDKSSSWELGLIILISSTMCIYGISAGKLAIKNGKNRETHSQNTGYINRQNSPIITPNISRDVNPSSNNISQSNTKQSSEPSRKAVDDSVSYQMTINALLVDKPLGLKASQIAEMTGIPKTTINHYLYSHQDLYKIDDSYKWYKR
jgi:hypothetical protein